MRAVRLFRAHLDSVTAILLALAYVAEVTLAERAPAGVPFVAGQPADDLIAQATAVAFLLSLATRGHLPLIPLGLAFVALAASGSGALEGLLSLTAGMVLAVYSVGAWAGGRAGQVGAVGVGGLAGVAVVRAATAPFEARDVLVPVVVVVGPWLLGLALRSLRAARGDERVLSDLDWEQLAADRGTAGRDRLVRELRDLVEHDMSTVILQARSAQASLRREPDLARRSLRAIEAAGTETLLEAQRLTGLLLTPDGAPLPDLTPGLAEVEELADQVGQAGLPVDVRIEGRPLPLTPDLDSVAYRVVQEALLSTLEHAVSAHARVVVRYERDELQVEVTDDGIAVEGDDPEEETAGLVAARESVAALGGSLDAGPGDDRGYWVLARLPYEPDTDG